MFTLRTLTTIGLFLVLAAGASAADKHGLPGKTHAKLSPQGKAVHNARPHKSETMGNFQLQEANNVHGSGGDGERPMLTSAKQLQFRGSRSAARGTPRAASGLVWNETGEVGSKGVTPRAASGLVWNETGEVGSRGLTSSGPTVRGMVIMPDPGLKAGSPKFGSNRPNLMSTFNEAANIVEPMPK